MAQPNTMRAWQYTNHDRQNRGIEHNLTLNNIPIPEPSPDQHLVKVIAAGLNPADAKLFEDIIGFVTRTLGTSKNATPGLDFAGRVVIPAANSGVREGQIIFGVASASPFSTRGTLSEYATIDKTLSAVVPDGVDPLHAAACTVAGVSAYQSILTYAKAGDRIFINGGSGGTGIFGVQIAKASGIHVTTTCSTANLELVRSLGADEVIDYTKVDSLADVLARKEPFDLVVDNVGLDWGLYYSAHRYTKPGAPYVMVAGGWLKHILGMLKAMVTPAVFGGGKRPLKSLEPKPRIEDAVQVINWIAEGRVKVVVDSTFDLENVPAAFTRVKTNRAKGKVIIKISDP